MTDEQKTTVKGYVTTLDDSIAGGELLDLLVDAVSDRVLLYLNETTIADGLLRVIAQIVVANYHAATSPGEQSIAAVIDNGQEVRYHQTPVTRFAAKSDSEIFGGFEKLLASYRRVHVITS